MGMLGTSCSPCCSADCFPNTTNYGCTFSAGLTLRATISGVVGDGSCSGWGETNQPNAINGEWCLANSASEPCTFTSWDCGCTNTGDYNNTGPQRPALEIKFCKSNAGTLAETGVPLMLLYACSSSALQPFALVFVRTPAAYYDDAPFRAAYVWATRGHWGKRLIDNQTLCSSLLSGNTITMTNPDTEVDWGKDCPDGNAFQPWDFRGATIEFEIDATCTDNLTQVPCAWWCNGRGFADNMTRSPPSQIKVVVTNSGVAARLDGTYYLDFDQTGSLSAPTPVGTALGANKYGVSSIFAVPSRCAIQENQFGRPFIDWPCNAPADDTFYWHMFDGTHPDSNGDFYLFSISDTAPSCTPPTTTQTVTKTSSLGTRSVTYQVSAV